MNKEEILNKYIDLIDKGYCCACNELNCIDNFPQAKIAHSIRELQQENQQLKSVLNKVREYIKERKKYKGEPFYLDEIQTEIVEEILDKVGGSNES